MAETHSTSCSLASKKCIPCRGNVPPLTGEDLERLSVQLPDWNVIEEHHLRRTFKFADFAAALAFVNRIGEVAERENHHPWIHFTWGKVEVEIWTHKINGLTESDFIMAAKIGQIS